MKYFFSLILGLPKKIYSTPFFKRNGIKGTKYVPALSKAKGRNSKKVSK